MGEMLSMERKFANARLYETFMDSNWFSDHAKHYCKEDVWRSEASLGAQSSILTLDRVFHCEKILVNPKP